MSQNQGTSFENDLGTFGIRTLNFGVHLETGITWKMVEFSMVLCCHHMKGRCFFYWWSHKTSTRYDQRGHGDVFSTHGVICIGCWHGLAVSLGSSVFLKGIAWKVVEKTLNELRNPWIPHVQVGKACVFRGNGMGCWVCKSTKCRCSTS